MFYISRVSGKTEGPFSVEQIDDMIAEQELLPHHMVIREGGQAWVDASRHPELARRFMAGGASMTPPPLDRFRSGGTAYAGFWLRFAAWLVDCLIVGAVSSVVIIALMMVAGLLAAAASGAGNGPPGANQPSVGFVVVGCFAYALPVVFYWLYCAYFESSERQATPGKMMLGIKVVDLEGHRIGFGQATGRFGGKLLSGAIMYIGYIMAAFTERKQALHDMLAGTLVVMKG